jgi:hypothetical protein
MGESAWLFSLLSATSALVSLPAFVSAIAFLRRGLSGIRCVSTRRTNTPSTQCLDGSGNTQSHETTDGDGGGADWSYCNVGQPPVFLGRS